MLLLLNVAANFYWIVLYLEPHIYEIQGNRLMCSYRTGYRFLKKILFFSYFRRTSLNIYLVFIPFHIQSLCPPGQAREAGQPNLDRCEQGGRGLSLKNHWKHADIFYGWPQKMVVCLLFGLFHRHHFFNITLVIWLFAYFGIKEKIG